VQALYQKETARLGYIAKDVLPLETFLAEIQRIPFQRTSLSEGLWALMPYVGNCGESSGAYYPVSGRVSADDSDSENKLGVGLNCDFCVDRLA
jgi:hypothetical protein